MDFMDFYGFYILDIIFTLKLRTFGILEILRHYFSRDTGVEKNNNKNNNNKSNK